MRHTVQKFGKLSEQRTSDPRTYRGGGLCDSHNSAYFRIFFRIFWLFGSLLTALCMLLLVPGAELQLRICAPSIQSQGDRFLQLAESNGQGNISE